MKKILTFFVLILFCNISFAELTDKDAIRIITYFFNSVQSENINQLSKIILTRDKQRILNAYELSFKTLDITYENVEIKKIIQGNNSGIIIVKTTALVANPFEKTQFRNDFSYAFFVVKENNNWFIARIVNEDDFDRLLKYVYLKKYSEFTKPDSPIHISYENGDNGKYTIVGCFTDTADRDLKGLYFVDNGLTVEKCIKACEEKGFKYAGVQFGTNCFCGNNYGKFGKSDNCNMPCPGNKNEICGGIWANNIYKIIKNSSKSSEKWYKDWQIIVENNENIFNSNEKFGWKPTVKRIGDANPPVGGNGGALYLHPLSQTIPEQLKRVVFVNSPNMKLKIRIAGNQNGDFILEIKINGKQKFINVIDGKKWHDIEIPLSEFYNTYADIDIFIKANNWYFEYAFIDEIKIE